MTSTALMAEIAEQSQPTKAKQRVPRFELGKSDASYPERLLSFEGPPPVIYGLGNEGALDRGVAIIGARNATPYGKRAAKLVASWAADLGLVVYSGGARGCDQAAHQGALEAGGTTVAVMGCGADIVYPSRSGKLLDQVAAQGAVVSQYPWQTPPMKYRFRERNRLIAALSDLVIVVEARLPSGTLSTVQHALEMGVQVAAVPGSIFCLEAAAPNRLISEGALPISCREDLSLACDFMTSRPNAPLIQDELALFDDASLDGRLLGALRSNPALPGELSTDLECSLEEVLETLGMLEIQGKVLRFPDGRYGSS